MAGWTQDYTFDDAGLRRRLMAYAANARDLSAPMEKIGIAGMASTDMRFEREVGPDGQAWAALAPSTIRRKAKAGRERKLQWSGRLRSSFTRQVTANSVTWGTNLPYANAQQNGAQISRHAQTVLDSRISLRRAMRTVKRKDGTEVEFSGFLFAREGDKRVVAQARRVVGAGTIVIPARPFAGINEAEKADYIKTVRDHVLKRGES
jgi:phage gpG-like protein